MSDIERQIRAVLRNKYFRRGLRTIKKVESITEPIAAAFKNPSVPAFAHAGMKMIGELDDAYNIHTTEDFWEESYDKQDWHAFPHDSLHSHVISMVREKVIESIDISSYIKILIADYDGVVFGWACCMLSSGLTIEDELHVLSRESMPRARALVKKLVWDNSVSKHVQVTFSTMLKMLERRNSIQIKPDDVHSVYRTERAKEWCHRIQRFLARDQNRSYMFYGPPGTGKSSLIRSVTEMLELTSVRVNVEHLQSQNGAVISDVIEIFEPDAVIIDDVDRASESLMIQLLDILEQYKKHIKVIFMSANWIENFDCATIRPGRIDELVPITKLDDLAVHTILGEQHECLFERVKAWPVAYIVEATKRKEVDTPERFEESMRELRLRCEHDSLAFNDSDPIGLSLTQEQETEMKAAREAKSSGKNDDDATPKKSQGFGRKRKKSSKRRLLISNFQVTGSQTSQQQTSEEKGTSTNTSLLHSTLRSDIITTNEEVEKANKELLDEILGDQLPEDIAY